MYVIFNVIVLFLSLLGLSYLLNSIALKLFSNKKDKILFFITIKPDTDDVEMRINSAKSRINSLSNNFLCELLIVDCGMSDENYKICEILAREYNYISICKKNEFQEIISSISLQKDDNYNILSYELEK